MTIMKKYSRIGVALFFALLIGVCAWTLKDYTGSYDEYVLWNTIRVNLHEYAELLEKLGIRWETGLKLDVEDISVHSDRDHGMAPFYLCAPFLTQMDASVGFSSTIWCAITLIWFMAGVWALYAIARNLGLPAGLSCLAALLFYLSPRMFAEGHFSDRDVVLLCVSLLCLWQGVRFLKNLKISTGLLFSFFGALAAQIRIPGIIAWGLIGAAAVVMVTAAQKWNKQTALVALGTVVSFAGFYVMLTPATWKGPAEYFGYLFGGLAEYGWCGSIYFRGALFQLPENQLPFYYLLYMVLTTIPLYTFPLCAVGQLKAINDAVKKPRDFFASAKGVYLAATTLMWLVPIAGFAAVTPVVYNGWRHFYFLYAGILILSAYGIQALWQMCADRLWLKRAFAAALCFCLAVSAVGLAVNHPNQASYYNVLAGNSIMETDYWNTSGAYALKRLIHTEERNKELPLEVGCYFFDIQNARFKLSEEEKAVLTTTIDKDSPYLYYIENYVHVYDVPDPEGYHVLFTVESYGRLVGTMYERD